MSDSQPTPRQVLYALVAGGFAIIVAILVIGGAVAGLVPTWWTVTMGVLLSAGSVWMASRWQRTGPVLMVAIGTFVVWLVGTLALAT